MSRQRPGKSTPETPLRTLPGGIISGPSQAAVGEPRAPQAPQAPAAGDKKGSSVSAPTFLGRFGAIELENKGSVARDHLALERTFLAWLRTSLAFASIGVAITQLFRLNVASDSTTTPPLANMGKFLGATFVGISMVVLALGSHRYYESQGWLLKGKFPASRGSIYTIALIAFLLITASLVIVLIGRPESTEL